MVRTAVKPLAAGVIALSLESTPVALENLSRILQVSQDLTTIDITEGGKKCLLTCLLGGGRVSLGGLWVWLVG